jgi:tetratricopeptide (TPR) repeat protein
MNRMKIAMLAAVVGWAWPVGVGAAPAKKPKPDAKGDAKDKKNADPSGDAAPAAPSDRPKSDFDTAVDFFNQQDATGAWTKDRCEKAAARFQDSGKGKLAEAYFNAGVAYQRCQDFDSAESMYKKALGLNPKHAPSLANLAEIALRRGKRDDAMNLLKQAIDNDSNLQVSSARTNLGWLQYQELRRTTDAAARAKLEEQAIRNLQSALAVDSDDVVAYTVLALLHMEGADKNRNRLDLAQLLVDEGKKRDEKYAPLWNASGLLKMKRGAVAQALADFRQAVMLDPQNFEARMNAAQILLSSRNYNEAETQFREGLKLRPKSYEATIGLGIALRGQATVFRAQSQTADFARKLDEAERTYNDALSLDKNRADAFYNLGLLYMDYRTNDPDAQKNIAQYKKAKQYFQDFLSRADKADTKVKDAQALIAKCDKYVQILGQNP